MRMKLLSLKLIHEQENADPALSCSRSGLCLYRSSDSVERQKVSTHDMGCGAPARTDDFQHGVRGRRLAFDLNGQDAKQQDLDSCTGCIPASRA